MAKVALASSGLVGTIAAATSYFSAIGLTGISQETTEANTQITQRTAGVYSLMYARVSANTLDGATVIRTRKNGVNGNQTFSIGTGATGTFEDVVNTDTVGVGENWNYSITTAGTTGNVVIRDIIINFAATTSTVARYASVKQTAQTANTTNYWALSGSVGNNNTTEARAQSVLNSATTLRNLFVYVSANTTTANTTVRTRVATANGAQSVTIGSGATGVFEDTSNTDSVTAGQLVGYQTVSGATGTSITFRIISVEGVTTDGSYSAICDDSNGIAITTAAQITNLNGLGTSQTTEALYQRQMRVKSTISNSGINVSANTSGGPSFFSLRVNGVEMSLAASIGAAVTGNIQDTTHTVPVIAADLVNFKITPNGSGTVTVRSTWAQIKNNEGPFPSITF